MATVFVYDENGTLLKTIEKFCLINVSLKFVASELQVDPRNRSGYALGPGLTQLQPFSY
jgi:sugar diacid utilization regulator